ncbi:hypothetical protein [Methylotuvimicrobium sp. KM1]|uniref:hypothetical protein n=1 Tax=Methylotuvimicrobium sp. KM1 TaxID=3377707 RepID=UPI00384BF4AD
MKNNVGSEEGAVARSTGVGGREPPSSLHGRIHGVLSGEDRTITPPLNFHLPGRLPGCHER